MGIGRPHAASPDVSTAQRAPISPPTFALLILFAATAAFAGFRMAFAHTVSQHASHLDLLLAAIVVVGMASAFIRSSDVALPAFVVLTRATALIMGVFALIFYPAFGVVNAEAYDAVSTVFTIGRWVAVAAAVLAWWRPGLAVIPCAYVILAKQVVREATGIQLADTDYIVVAELGIFLTSGLVASTIGRWAFRASKVRIEADAAVKAALALLLMCAFGIHLSNYFTSAMVKVFLNGGPMSWALENQTHLLVLAGHYMGTLPVGVFERLSGLSYETFARVAVAANIVVLALQLASVVAVTRIRWIIALTLCFDLMHIGIFLLTGINFWVWVLLNLAIVATAIRLRGEIIPLYARIIPVGFVMFSISLFHIATLGWYDTARVTDIHFVAETPQGDHRVPSNYFLANSYALFHRGVIGNPYSGHYNAGPWGSVWRVEDMRSANACEVPPFEASAPDEAVLERVRGFIKAHHAYVVANASDTGRLNYDLFPHHHFSNPAMFARFDVLDKRTIIAYRFVVETSCLTYAEGAYGRRVIRRDGETIYVD